MSDQQRWSLSIGRFFGLEVRIHVSFFVILVVLGMAESASAGPPMRTCVFAGLTLLAALIHEWGYRWSARRIGLAVDEVVLWPLGGLRRPAPPEMAHAEFGLAVLGPGANLLACLTLAPAILLVDPDLIAFSPFAPPECDPTTALGIVAFAFWINWLLALANTLPAWPLDGGAAVRGWLVVRGHERMADPFLGRVALLAALTLAVVGFSLHVSQNPLPWALLSLSGLALGFLGQPEAAPTELEDESSDSMAYDLAEGFHTPADRATDVLDAAAPSLVQRWRIKRDEDQRTRQTSELLSDERRLDEILARLHGAGLASLDPEERALLDRVSERYRNRSFPPR